MSIKHAGRLPAPGWRLSGHNGVLKQMRSSAVFRFCSTTTGWPRRFRLHTGRGYEYGLGDYVGTARGAMNTQAHSLTWPWPVWRTSAKEALRAMLGEIEGLSITGGEASVRFSSEGIEFGRWLAGFSPSGVCSERLMGLPERVGMPDQGALRFREQWQSARQIYLSVEQTQAQVSAKVYLEYPLPAPDMRPLAPAQRQAALQIESCKWRFDAATAKPASARQTEYWRVSGLDGAATVQLLREAAGLAPAPRSLYAAVAQVLENALRVAPIWQGYRLLLVREPGSARQGVGVRFYDSALRTGAVLEPLSHLFEAWGLNPAGLSPANAFWATQELGWLQAGLDAKGQPFVNVYGALSSADTRLVLSRVRHEPSQHRATNQMGLV